MSEQIQKLFDLSSKTAIITGGSGVLGTEMGKALGASGANVVILDLNGEMADARAEDLKKLGYSALGVKASVLDQEDLEKARAIILDAYGKIDILVNAAGGNQAGATIMPEQTFFDLNIEAFKKVNDLNFLGTVLPTYVFAEDMAKNKQGSIINISSMSSTRAITRVVGYSAAKAAVDNFTRWMSVELATKYGDGIRVNAMAPGFFVTEQNRTLLTNPDGSYTQRGETVIGMTPMDRFGVPEDLNGTLLWLSSDASRFVTGIVVPIDGGFSAFSGV
ncbi:MAG: SDR family oxidoreductase [Cyclobacteriaceae bacterium]|nr:SDR family oxidoreductase [Cyclobacteriaceae bacterium]